MSELVTATKLFNFIVLQRLRTKVHKVLS